MDGRDLLPRTWHSQGIRIQECGEGYWSWQWFSIVFNCKSAKDPGPRIVIEGFQETARKCGTISKNKNCGKYFNQCGKSVVFLLSKWCLNYFAAFTAINFVDTLQILLIKYHQRSLWTVLNTRMESKIFFSDLLLCLLY